MSRIANTVIDELVAGDLSGNAYRQVLIELDREPDGWKRCALAFLEDQAWQQDLSQLASDDLQPRSTTGETHAFTGERDVEGRSMTEASSSEVAPTSVEEHDQPQAAAKHRRRLDWMSRFTSLAALLLVSFTIGWFGSDFSNLAGFANRSAGGDKQPRQVVSPTDNVNANQSPSSAASPLYESSGNSLELASEGLIPWEQRPPEYLQQLQRRGQIELEFSDAFVPVEDSGVVRLVPVRQYSVRPKVFSY